MNYTKAISLLLMVLTVLIVILAYPKTTDASISQISSLAIKSDLEKCKAGLCDIFNCDSSPDSCLLQNQKSKWESLKSYAKKCESDINNCDILQKKVITLINSENNNDKTGFSGKSEIEKFLNSKFYSKNHLDLEKFANENNFDVNKLYSIFINEGGYKFKSFKDSVRFECHQFNKNKNFLVKSMPCTFKNGETFSRILSETNYQAYLTAKSLDPELAFRSSSFGISQMMGFNYIDLGLNIDFEGGLDKFSDERLQLTYFFKFLKKRKIISQLQSKNWNEIAKKYNGEKYASTNYNNRLANNFEILNNLGGISDVVSLTVENEKTKNFIKKYPFITPKFAIFKRFGTISPRHVVLHHTGGGTVKSAENAMKNHKDDLGVHFVIDRGGEVFMYANLNNKVRHAGPANSEIGIEIVNRGIDQEYTQEQYASIKRLLIAIDNEIGLKVEGDIPKVMGHFEVFKLYGSGTSGKWDPSPNFNWEKIGYPRSKTLLSMHCASSNEFQGVCFKPTTALS